MMRTKLRSLKLLFWEMDLLGSHLLYREFVISSLTNSISKLLDVSFTHRSFVIRKIKKLSLRFGTLEDSPFLVR